MISALVLAVISALTPPFAVRSLEVSGFGHGHQESSKLREMPPTKQFPRPERIRYDGHCLQIDGKDIFIYSASFHYFRTPRELWRDRFAKLKKAGFNTVETYTPWNWHERTMPSNLGDFSKIDLSELQAWLKMAQDQFGLYTIVRPGPFICAEWAGGGYPRWLAKFGPGNGGLWLRGSDDVHIAWSVHWYDAVCKLFAREQVTRKPKGGKGIILVQIENEFDSDGCKDKPKVLKALYNAVRHSGVEVPVFTCLTSECRGSSDPTLAQVFDCDNYYVGLKDTPSCSIRMAELRRQQPDAPGFVTELQGGWFSTIGGSLSEDHYSDARHFNAIQWMSMLGGATGLNTYMFVGGTHFGDWGARGQTTSYDYNAGIHEWGSRGPKYAVAQGVAEFLRDNGSKLVRAEGGPCKLDGSAKSLFGGVRVAPDGTRFVFLLNNDPDHPAFGQTTVSPSTFAKPTDPMYNVNQNGKQILIATSSDAPGTLSLPPFKLSYHLGALGAGVLVIPPHKSPAEGVWYPKPQEPISRPSSDPQAIRISTVLKRDEDFGVKWQKLSSGDSLPDLGVCDQRYVLYRSRFTLSKDEITTCTRLLINSFTRDIVSAQINGKLAKRTHPSDSYASSAYRNLDTSFTRIGPSDFDNRFDVSGMLQEGSNEIDLVYENIGFEHGYVPMEELSGIRKVGLGGDEKSIRKTLPLEVSTDLGGIANAWFRPNYIPRGWQSVQLDTGFNIPRKGNGIQPKGKNDALLTWYRLEFELPPVKPGVFVPWALRINASGNGEMYLNGNDMGRHFEAGPQREFYLPECWLKRGVGQKNVIAIGLRQTMNGALIRAAEIGPYLGSAELLGSALRKKSVSMAREKRSQRSSAPATDKQTKARS